MKFSGLSGFLISAIVFLTFTASGQVWFEDFSGEANGATSGTATGTVGGTWTTILPTGGAASFSRVNVGAPFGGIFMVNNTGTEGIWQSNSMNIAALGEVALEVILGGNDATNADYVRAYYRIDGGPEIMFGESIGRPGLAVFAASSAVVTGTTLQIVIRGMDNSGGGGLMGFDDVTVTDISVLYSIANSAWNNGNTWSTAGFGGGPCACTPNADSRVIIGNGITVDFTADGSAAGVEIQNTGILEWVGNGNDLTLERGGDLDVQSGGVLTRLATNGSSITFGNYAYTATIAGALDIGLMTFNASGSSMIVNSGILTLAAATGLVMNGGNGSTITNTGTFNLTGMDLNNNDLIINNAGTINQSGNFIDIDTGSDFNNLATGVWNWSLTPNTTYDASVNAVLDCSAVGNTFNYNSAGMQRIIPISYHNLSLSTAGAKDANNASFDVRGNWLVSGTATFNEGSGTITLNGMGAQTVTNPSGETFNNLVINNSSSASPQITLNSSVTVNGVLTMLSGNLDLNMNTFVLTSSAAGSLVHNLTGAAGWMFGGSVQRAFATTAIAVGNARGLFPLGDPWDFRPFLIGKTNAVSSNGTMTVDYTPAYTATDVSFTDNTIPPSGSTVTIQRRHDSFWTVTKSGMMAGTYDLSAGGTGFIVADVNDLRLTRAVDATGIGTAVASTISGSDVRANRTGLTPGQLINNFYVASLDANNTPLPITLVYFRSKIQGDEVISTWKTAQETNNHFFTVQKTTDFEIFYEVGKVYGRGDSKEESTYSFVDDSPFPGRSYYRLKQTDFDGVSSFSDPVMIDYHGPHLPVLRAYPNPFRGKQISIELKGFDESLDVPLEIYDQQGKKVMEAIMDEYGPGSFKKEIIFRESLPPGLYIMKAGRALQLNRRIVVY